jgi:hypothetical protein
VSRDSETVDALPELVLGILPPDEEEAVAAALGGASGGALGPGGGVDLAALSARIRQAERAVEAALVDVLPVVHPGTGARDRLLATLCSPDRFREFFPTLRRWFDLDDAGLGAVIARIDAGTSWKDTPFAGMRYFRFSAGPGALGRESGCVLLAAGARFPRHRHRGHERSIILEGSLTLDGRRCHAGDVIESPIGSAHEFVSGTGRDLVILTSHDGIAFDG